MKEVNVNSERDTKLIQEVRKKMKPPREGGSRIRVKIKKKIS